MRFIQTFTYLFKYDDWFPSVGLGMLFSLIPIVGPIVVHGWFVRLMRLRISGDEHTLPPLSLSDFGGLLREGGIPFLVNLVLALPMMIFVYIMLASVFGVFLVGVGLGAALEPAMGELGVAVGLGVGAVAALIVYLVFMVAVVAVGAAMHVFILRAEVTAQFGAAFQMAAVTERTSPACSSRC